MKKENRLKNRIVQFSYDHQGIGVEFLKMQKSAKEVSKILDNMLPKPEKEKNNEEN